MKPDAEKVVSIMRSHDGSIIALTSEGRIFERVRDPRADPNYAGRNPQQGMMWVERPNPFSNQE